MLDEEDINLVKCSDEDVDEVYGIGYLPRLVYFQRGIPDPFGGDERNPDQIVQWAKQQVETKELITVNRAILVRRDTAACRRILGEFSCKIEFSLQKILNF